MTTASGPKPDHRQDIFLATLAHELRNPLAPIRTAAHVLRYAGANAARVAWAADVISRQVAAMGLLLDDLLEISRITQGSLTLNKERLSLRGVVDAALELARPALDERGHDLVVRGDALDQSMEGDPLRLAQVLGNLLNNAARYTPRGGLVTLAVQAQPTHVSCGCRTAASAWRWCAAWCRCMAATSARTAKGPAGTAPFA